MGQVTIKDIAEMAGVSKTIVSQYLNNNYKFMSAKTKDKIEKIIKETNYIPKSSARNLKFKKITVLNIIVANLESSFSTQIVQQMDKRLNSEKIHVIISNSADDEKKERLLIEQAISQDVDQVVIFPVSNNPEHYQLLKRNNIATVYVDRLPSEKGACVLLDNQEAITESVASLVARGNKQIAYLSLPLVEYLTPRVERLQAFNQAMTSEESVLPTVISGSEATLKKRLETLLKSKNYVPTAFIASNDTCLKILLRALKESHYHGKDFDIVTVDGLELFDLFDDIYMTIEHPIAEICTKIIDCLNNQTDNQQVFRFSPIYYRRGGK